MISNLIKIYKLTPKNKFFNPLYWLKVFLCWPIPVEWMNMFSREKIYCIFDNMDEDNRIIINARCVPDAGFLWKRNINFTKFRLGRVFCKVSGTFMNEIWVNVDGKSFTFNSTNGDIVPTSSIKSMKIKIEPKGREPKYPDILNIDVIINCGNKVGSIKLSTIDRGIKLLFDPNYKKSLTEFNCRGAMVSSRRVVRLKYLEQMLEV